MNTIVLTGGGTAGHVTPHIALIPHLKKIFDDIVYIGSENGMEKNMIERLGITYYDIPCTKLVRKFTFKNFKIPFVLHKGIKQAEKILDKIKPKVVFSKGGFVALPVVIAAYKKNIPVIAHESDYTVGLANKISSIYCDKVLTSFPQTAKTMKKGVAVGSPIKDNLFTVTKKDGLKAFGLDGNKPVLLITGGSLGASAINDTVRKALSELIKKFDIIHICGKGNLSKKLLKGYVQVEFTDKMEYAFAAADICISRGGANTLFEIASLSIPALIIPLPKGISRGDQILNARYFNSLGVMDILYQENLSPKNLIYSVNKLYGNSENIKKSYGEKPIKNAISKICDILSKYVK